jgi:O-antigen/teichoic acid export membrane protein
MSVPAADSSTPAVPIQRRSVARNTAALLLSQVTTWAIALVINTLQPRFLGPDRVGQLVLATAVWTMATVFTTWGTNMLVTIKLARDATQSEIVGRAMGVQLILFAAGSVVVGLYSLVAGYSSAVISLIAIIGVASLLGCITGPIFAAYTGIEQMDVPALVGTLTRLGSAVLLVVVLLTTANVQLIALVGVLGTIASLVILGPRLSRLLPHRPRPSVHQPVQMLREGWPFLLNDATLVVYLSIDTLVISLLATEREIGWYAAADTLFGTLYFIPNIVMASMFPVLARLDAEDRVERDRFIERSFAMLSLASVPLGLGTFAIASPAARLLFGADFAESGPVLQYFGLVIMLGFITILLGRVSLATGHAKLWATLMIVAIVVSIPLDILLVPWTHDRYGNGAIGGALSYLITETVILVPAIYWVAPHLINRRVMTRLVKVLIAGGAMLAAVWPIRERLIIIPILVGAVVYTGLIALLRVLDDDEVQMVRTFKDRIVGRTLRRGT